MGLTDLEQAVHLEVMALKLLEPDTTEEAQILCKAYSMFVYTHRELILDILDEHLSLKRTGRI